jgi:glycerol-3-phosphate acyltransferase PlsY
VLLVLGLLPVAYLVGTFPSAGLVARTQGHDIHREGSGNPGASNTFRVLGWKAGVVVLVLDVGKGSLAAGAGLAIDGHRGAFILGIAAVLGHIFPVWHRFKGGRGVATAAGVMAVVFPLETAVLSVVWFAIARGLHKASVASVLCALAFPAIVVALDGSALDIAVTGIIAGLVVARHLANLRRLVRGEEHGFGRDDDGGSVAA